MGLVCLSDRLYLRRRQVIQRRDRVVEIDVSLEDGVAVQPICVGHGPNDFDVRLVDRAEQLVVDVHRVEAALRGDVSRRSGCCLRCGCVGCAHLPLHRRMIRVRRLCLRSRGISRAHLARNGRCFAFAGSIDRIDGHWCAAPRAALLDDMGQLMCHQCVAAAWPCARRLPAEEDVAAERERARTQGLIEGVRLSVRVNVDVGEVLPEARFHRLLHGWIQRRATPLPCTNALPKARGQRFRPRGRSVVRAD